MVGAERPIVISLVRGAEREATLAFVRKFMMARVRSAPPPPPSLLFAARQGNAIAGSISLDFDKRGVLPFEHIRRFSDPLVLDPYPRERAAQFGRWAARTPGLSAALGYAAALYALKHGRVLGFCEAKPPTVSRMKSLGIELTLIPNEGVNLSRIPPEGRPYYATSPTPELFVMDLHQVKAELAEHACSPLEASRVLLEPSLL